MYDESWKNWMSKNNALHFKYMNASIQDTAFRYTYEVHNANWNGLTYKVDVQSVMKKCKHLFWEFYNFFSSLWNMLFSHISLSSTCYIQVLPRRYLYFERWIENKITEFVTNGMSRFILIYIGILFTYVCFFMLFYIVIHVCCVILC